MQDSHLNKVTVAFSKIRLNALSDKPWRQGPLDNWFSGHTFCQSNQVFFRQWNDGGIVDQGIGTATILPAQNLGRIIWQPGDIALLVLEQNAGIVFTRQISNLHRFYRGAFGGNPCSDSRGASDRFDTHA